MEYILRTNTVSKKYTNYYAVDKVSISIKKGEIYGLIGENGAGKSTLMKMIAGLVEPSEGSVELFGNFVPQTERYRIGCVIESPALYAELTAKQNLEVFRKAYGLSSKESVQQILKQVGLSQYENKIVKKFSLGMKQRLAIGVALLGNPDFLILDEPINGLDPTGIQDMRNFLLKLNREEHITIMISSHILGELSKIATKYGIIKNGKLIEEITAKELNEKCQCCLKIKASYDDNENYHFSFQNFTDSINESDIDKIFNRFYTTDLSRSRKTTGLGLTIAKNLTVKMGGSISASLNNNVFEIVVCFPKQKG